MASIADSIRTGRLLGETEGARMGTLTHVSSYIMGINKTSLGEETQANSGIGQYFIASYERCDISGSQLPDIFVPFWLVRLDHICN